MSRPWDDCKFFLTSVCRNAKCQFRHSEVAKANTEYCTEWAAGLCRDMTCPKKHIHNTQSSIACRFEFAPGGCKNSACGFKHTLPRENDELKKKLASLLAEQEQSKPAVESEDEELDLDALRAQALKSVEPKTTKKRKSAGGTEDGEIVEKAKKKKPNRPLQNVRLRLGPQPTVTSKPPTGLQRRIITTKSEYSEDEVSDLSLDELTDEEHEDLRTTLNKNKTIKRVQNVTVTKSNRNGDSSRLIRKINVKSPVKKEQSRLITLRKQSADEDQQSSRPSSSEWIERKIKVKQSSSEYSDSEREIQKEPTRQVKRKPNLAWVGLSQNDSTEEADFYKRKNSSDRGSVEFNRRITVQNDRFKETTKAKGNVKARLGGQVKSNIKSRLGESLHTGIESRLGKKIESAPKPKTVSLKRENPTAPLETPVIKKRMEKEKTPEPVDAKSTVATTITAPKEISPLPKKTDRLNSTQDLEADLLQSDDELDDLELGNEIDDDELFA